MPKIWKNICKLFNDRPIFGCIGLSVLLTMFLELLGAESFLGLINIAISPLMFVYNTAIVMLTLLVALLFPWRRFMLLLISLIWMALGITNCVLLQLRGTPLSAIDFTILRSAYTMMDVYLSKVQLIMLAVVIVGVLIGLIIVFRRAPRIRPRYPQTMSAFLIVGAIVLAPMNTVIKAENITEKYRDLAQAYENYGFACCFAYSIFNTGIEESTNYSQMAVQTVMAQLPQNTSQMPDRMPNIVMVQLESFFDPTLIEGVEYSKDPIPNFRKLRSKFSGGVLQVPVVGGGTANTEFEVLSGMSTEFFGIGEYPYQTTLTDSTCESICHHLKPLGYTAHAIHNHTATFYDRDLVYENLGFDTFTSAEYMQDYDVTPLGWIADSALEPEIMNALNSTQGTDFVYAVSVQCHGKYPDELPKNTPDEISVETAQEDWASLTYYINQLHTVDQALQALTETLAMYSEPTVLVVYGDHLPCLEMENFRLTSGTEYETEYIIWANFPMEKQEKNLAAYQLTAEVLCRLDLPGSVLSRLHQTSGQEANYKEKLQILQYDLLFGRNYAMEKPKKTQLKMGILPVCIEDVKISGRNITIFGENFTAASRIVLNGKELKTRWISSTRLQARIEQRTTVESVQVAQVAENGKQLSITEEKQIHDGQIRTGGSR